MTINQLQLAFEEAERINQLAVNQFDAAAAKIRDRIVAILRHHMDDDDAVIVRPIVEESYWGCGTFEFRCEIAFNTPEGKRDFGSDFWLGFREGKLEFNQGTIGSYGLNNIYQLKRNRMLYHLTFLYGQFIEHEIKNIDCEEFEAARALLRETSSKKNDAKRAYELAKKDEADKQIENGAVFINTSNASRYTRISEVFRYGDWKDDSYKVTKVTPKFVELEVLNNCCIAKDKVRRQLLIDRLVEGMITRVNNEH